MTFRSLLLLVLGCVALATLRAEGPASFEVGSFTFKRPDAWGWVPTTGSMRKAELSVPGQGTSGAVTFFHFGSGGAGDVQSNVQRWFNQFKGAPEAQKIEEQKYGSTKVTFATTEGTFSSGMPGGPAAQIENFALVAAILESAEGSVFVKFTGPKTLVQAQRQQFVDFVADAAKAAK